MGLESCVICPRIILCRWLGGEFKVPSLFTHDGTWLTPGTEGLLQEAEEPHLEEMSLWQGRVFWSSASFLPTTSQHSYKLRMAQSQQAEQQVSGRSTNGVPAQPPFPLQPLNTPSPSTKCSTCSTRPERGSITRSFLSLHVVVSRLPSVLKDMQRITSVWQSIIFTGSPMSRFQMRTCEGRDAGGEVSSCHGPGCLSFIHTNRSWQELPAQGLGYSGMQAHCQGFCIERQIHLNYTPVFILIITLTGSKDCQDNALDISVRSFLDWVNWGGKIYLMWTVPLCGLQLNEKVKTR